MAEGRDVPRTTVKQALQQLVLGILGFDAIVLSVWYLTGMERAAPDARTRFAVVWMFATALIVAFLLRRVRRARMMPLR